MKLATLALVIFLAAVSANADTWMITPGGPMTIQDAINAAADGDTIVLGPGTYIGAGNRAVSVSAKRLVVTSSAGAATTFIDCELAARAFTYSGVPAGTSVLEGVTIRNGGGAFASDGGAVWVPNGDPAATLLIRDSVFENNGVSFLGGAIADGGAIYLNDIGIVLEGNVFDDNHSRITGGAARLVNSSDVQISNNRFENNGSFQCNIDCVSGIGGAIAMGNCSGLVENNEFVSNGAGIRGGAMHLSASTIAVNGNSFHMNRAVGDVNRSGGGGVWVSDGQVSFSENLFWRNSGFLGGGGIWLDGGAHSISQCTFVDNTGGSDFGGTAILAQGVSPTIDACIFSFANFGGTTTVVGCADNAAPTISCSSFSGISPNHIAAPCAGTVVDTINADPLFCDPVNNDYSLDGASPCAAANNSCGVRFGAFDPKCGVLPVLFTGVNVDVRPFAVNVQWDLFADEDVAELRVLRRTENQAARVLAVFSDIAVASFADRDVVPGERYLYSVTAVLPDGSEVRSAEAMANVPRASLSLQQNLPNPFNRETSIGFVLNEPADVDLAVYDVAGRRVATLARGRFPAGAHVADWTLRDGKTPPVGIYFYRLTAGNRVLTRKMTLVR